jgi:hypothetical protein
VRGGEEKDMQFSDPAFWQAGGVSIIAVMSVVLVL